MYSEKVLENAKKSIEIANQILQGKAVEYRYKDHWIDSKDPLTTVNDIEYRLKKETVLVPFDFNNAGKLIGRAIKLKDVEAISMITFVNKEGVTINQKHINYSELFENYTFIDNTPCGKIEI